MPLGSIEKTAAGRQRRPLLFGAPKMVANDFLGWRSRRAEGSSEIWKGGLKMKPKLFQVL
jgi:hypothetical protein